MAQPPTLEDAVLLRLIRFPATAAQLTTEEWEDVLWQARASRLDGFLWRHLRDEKLPATVHRRLLGAFRAGEHCRRQLLWEIDCLRRVLGEVAPDFIVLKGGAYAALGLDFAEGRPAGDLDIMVPMELLPEVERVLLRSGWEHVIVDPYDQRYYRSWMHELPPLRHRDRATELDLHHAISPRSSRLRVQMPPIFSAAVGIDLVRVLSPPDLLLHCAVHLFHDGEIAGSLRDLVDFDRLLRHFAGEDFWNGLVPRARRLGVGRPLFHALRYSRRLLGTPIPAAILAAAETGRPVFPVLTLMDVAVPHALVPAASARARWIARISRFLLYIRSHWLRMSMLPLMSHLARKLARRWSLRPSKA